MKYIIDRFEELYAVCEDENRNMLHILRSLLPEDSKAGDVLILQENTYQIDPDETEKRRETLKNRLKALGISNSER